MCYLTGKIISANFHDKAVSITYKRPEVLLRRCVCDAVAVEKESVRVSKKVSKNQQEILDAIAKNPSVSLDDLAEIVGIARKNIGANIRKLKELGRLRRVGSKRSGHREILK